MLPITNIFNKSNHLKNTEDLFLALAINERKVSAGLWVFDQGRGKPLALGTLESWDGESSEELIVSSDVSIASAIANLQGISGRQPNKVLLGLPESWVDGNTVKDYRAKILQGVCRKLLLTPQGFVVIPEAITHFLKEKEGDLLSLILLQLEGSDAVISLVIQGKFLGSQIVSRSNNLALDLEEALLRFNYSGTLPPRILIMDGENLEDAKQNLVSYPWISPEKQKKTFFLQLPRVDFADKTLEIEAVIFAGGRDIFSGKTVNGEETKKSEEKIFDESKIETIVENENFEIISDKNVNNGEEDQELENKKTSFLLTGEEFGFINGEDISLKENLDTVPDNNFETVEILDNKVFSPDLPLEKKTNKIKSRISIFTFFPKKIFRNLLTIKTKFSIKAILGLIFGFLFILVIISILYLKIVKSEISIFIQPIKVEKTIEFSVVEGNSQFDLDKMILPTFKAATQVSGNKTIKVEGRKTVGDKASGEILIFNGTDKKRTFTRGTIIEGPDSLKFVVNEEVTVSGRTTDINSSPPVDKWGEGKTTIIASSIGTQYNISAGANLLLESNTGSASAIIIRNPSEFSGGSSREILAVSKEDRDNLRQALLSELHTQAESQLKTEIADGYLLTGNLTLEKQTDNYNYEIGDEAEELSLEETAEFSVFYFKRDDVVALAQKEISSLIPKGYQNQPVTENRQIENMDPKKNTYKLTINEQFYPEVKTDEISSKLKAKLLSQAKKIISKIEHVEGYEVQITPKIFSFLPIFPFSRNNIIVTVKSI